MVQIGEFLRVKSIGMETEEDQDEDDEGGESCERCGHEFASESEKSNHNLTCTPTTSQEDEKTINSSTFNCDECGKPFKRKEHLFQHKKLHTG